MIFIKAQEQGERGVIGENLWIENLRFWFIGYNKQFVAARVTITMLN